MNTPLPDAAVVLEAIRNSIADETGLDDLAFSETHVILSLTRQLALGNLAQWVAEDEARAADATDIQVASAKRKIDLLNRKRVDLINQLHEKFAKASAAHEGELPTSFVSPADVVDRLSVLFIRERTLRRAAALSPLDTSLQVSLTDCQSDLIHESNHLKSIISLLQESAVSLQARKISKVYSPQLAINARSNGGTSMHGDYNTDGMPESAAWQLHGEFKSDMRGFRDEEYKLAEMYFRFVTLVTTGQIAAVILVGDLMFVQNMKWVISIGLVVLLTIIAVRIYRNHRTYSDLKFKVEVIRAKYAKGWHARTPPSGASKLGAGLQVATLCIVTVFSIFAVFFVESKRPAQQEGRPSSPVASAPLNAASQDKPAR